MINVVKFVIFSLLLFFLKIICLVLVFVLYVGVVFFLVVDVLIVVFFFGVIDGVGDFDFDLLFDNNVGRFFSFS